MGPSAYTYVNSKGQTYYLHTKTVTLRGSQRTQVIYYFARDLRDGQLDQLPAGFEVFESGRTGMPMLRKLA